MFYLITLVTFIYLVDFLYQLHLEALTTRLRPSTAQMITECSIKLQMTSYTYWNVRDSFFSTTNFVQVHILIHSEQSATFFTL